MTDLTKQWKNGELPEGHYYVKDGENMIAEYLDGYFYNDGNPMTSFSGGVDSVLEKVPSYEEYTELKEELKDYEYQHKQDGICYNDLFCKLELARKENTKLKTFLKKAINLVMESNWENHAHYKDSIQLRDETNNLLNDSPSPTDLKQG